MQSALQRALAYLMRRQGQADAQWHGQGQCGERQGQGGGQRVCQGLSHWLAALQRMAQVQLQQAPECTAILLPQAAIEVVASAQFGHLCRVYRAWLAALCQQDRHRVTGQRVEDDERQGKCSPQHQQCLGQPPRYGVAISQRGHGLVASGCASQVS